jgi:hypothetical protein
VSTAVTPTGPPTDAPEWRRVRQGALIAAGVGLVVCAVGALVDLDQFYRAWLVAFLFVLGITLGSMVLVMLQHLTGGAWGLILRRPLESAARCLPLVVLLFLPVALGVPRIYEWAGGEWQKAYRDIHHDEPFSKADFLSPGFFYGRAAVYFVVWLLLMFFLNRWSREQDRTADPRLPRRFRLLSAPGLVLYGGTITLAAIDWIMSLQPDWSSTIFGVILGVGQVLSAFAFAIALLVLLAQYPPLRDVILPNHLRDLGNLMLAFVMLWAYMSFSQFLLIWAGNLTEEIPFYLYRGQGGWQWVAAALALFQFALPFVLLLSRDVKTGRGRLVGVALLVLVMRFVDLYWLVAPAPSVSGGPPVPLRVPWMDVGALLLLGGLWLLFYLWQLTREPLLPAGDPFLGDLREAPHYD